MHEYDLTVLVYQTLQASVDGAMLKCPYSINPHFNFLIAIWASASCIAQKRECEVFSEPTK